jgi:hypothetical protein
MRWVDEAASLTSTLIAALTPGSSWTIARSAESPASGT